MKTTMALCLYVLLITLSTVRAWAGPADPASAFAVEFESGAVWQGRNDVQIPNTEDGTRFSLDSFAGRGPWPAVRIYVTWNVRPRHYLRLLAAPLSYKESIEFEEPTDFAGKSFAAGVGTDATYKFNSYRITYGYRLHAGERWLWWVGFTAKVRDAKIQIEQAGNSSKETDLGFVPLLHLRGICKLAGGWSALIDRDALAGGPGRAEDLAIKLDYRLNERWSISGGYRTLEGGADVETVYNFAWLHYAVVSACLRF